MDNVGFLQFACERDDGTKDSFYTQSVPVAHEGADKYLALYEGRWRRVHIQVHRTYIVYMGEKIKIVIEGV